MTHRSRSPRSRQTEIEELETQAADLATKAESVRKTFHHATKTLKESDDATEKYEASELCKLKDTWASKELRLVEREIESAQSSVEDEPKLLLKARLTARAAAIRAAAARLAFIEMGISVVKARVNQVGWSYY